MNELSASVRRGREMVVDIREGEPSLVWRALLINMVMPEAPFSLMI